MIHAVGRGDGLARAAIEAALRAQARTAQGLQGPPVPQTIGEQVPGVDRAQAPQSVFPLSVEALSGGLREVDGALRAVDRLPIELVAGGIDDFAELAGRLKQSELTFKFALEIRNKLIDAYRETMRMSV
jgi:flagellar hook-basal body complex protein FliE